MQGNLRLWGTEHTVLMGFDWSEQRAKANRYIGPAPDLDLLNPIYGVPIATPTNPLADYRQTIRQAGLYLQDQIKLDDHWIHQPKANGQRLQRPGRPDLPGGQRPGALHQLFGIVHTQ
ncbi:hypothetical protein G6F40_016779 [Rhizopus arrhizus]|nr:hypothetical protein G6F40_016779 [Rhizopus arrhizus]